jgi:hypothetical protein
MKLRSVLLFSVVIALLPIAVIADEEAEELELKFKGEGSFQIVYDEDVGAFVYIPPGGFELLNVSHLGLSKVAWKLLVLPPLPGEPFGWFTITGANRRDSLEGIYDGFVITPTSLTTGTYDLEWLFTGGTGRFESAEGTGHTDGLVDFETGEAKYEFSGKVTVPEEKLLLARIAGGKATKTPVLATKYVTPSGLDPTREWTDEDGIWHVRGSVACVDFEGDLHGLGRAVVNLNFDMSTGNGDESGYCTAELTWGELSGTFEGHFSVTYTGFVGVGHGVYHGSGEFAGMKFMEDVIVILAETPPYVVYSEGIILDPHGQ